MLQVTADVFSGRPNPSWIIEDESQIREVLNEIARNRSVIAATDGGRAELGLGFRGLIVEPLSDELAKDYDLPASFRLSSGPALAGSKGPEIIERLTRSLSTAAPGYMVTDIEGAPDEALQSFLMDQLVTRSQVSTQDVSGAAQYEVQPEVVAAVTCMIELGAYNPGFWNNDLTTLRNNNCYNYASNKRTNTFAQPGRGSGHMYTALTCNEVTRAALSDGLHRRFDCFPDSERPRYLVALVIWPNRDYHWYRKQKEGFWGHKPGSTPARNVDNSNRVINDPATCDRGPYTQFCGYFYTCRSQKIR